jgi:hypothetical protein
VESEWPLPTTVVVQFERAVVYAPQQRLRGRSLAPLVKARGFGMTPALTVGILRLRRALRFAQRACPLRMTIGL